MIKCETEKGDIRLEIEGHPVDISADTMVIIEAIHELIKAKDSLDAAIYVKSLVVMLTDPELPFQAKNPLEDEVERLKKQNEAMTAYIRNNTDPDYLSDLCNLCRHYDQCQVEAENEDDQASRFWCCTDGWEFACKEVE